MADPLKERISLLTMGEAQGKLRPEHQAELDRYRASGLAKRSPTAPAAAATESAQALETSKARDSARAAMSTIDRIAPSLARVRKLQNTTMAPSGLQGAAEFNPWSSKNQEYDAAVANLTALVRPATRTPGEGSMSDFESKMAKAILPDRWKRDSYNNEALDGLDRLVATGRETFRTQLGLPQAPPSSGSGQRAPPNADALRSKYGLK